MDSREIRWRNFLYLADKFGRDKLAQKLGYNDVNYLNQIITRHTHIGPRAPRKWEKALSIDPGWFDNKHPELWEPEDSQLQIAEKPADHSSTASKPPSNDEIMSSLSDKQKKELWRRLTLEMAQDNK